MNEDRQRNNLNMNKMKKLNINLSDLSGEELSNREKLSLRGGSVEVGKCCTCGCCYEGEPGGSTIQANAMANHEGGMVTLCPETRACAVEDTNGGIRAADNCSPA